MTSLPNPASWLTGYIADLPTPFDADAELDLDAFAALCERQIDAGASAIVVGETAGEASTLTTAERIASFAVPSRPHKAAPASLRAPDPIRPIARSS